MARARKMVALNIEETSGVDHPAHLTEGWLVMKSEELTGMDDLLSDLKISTNKSDDRLLVKGTEEEPMSDENSVDTSVVAEEADKAAGDKKMSYEDMMSKISMLEDELSKTKDMLAKAEAELSKKKMKKSEEEVVDTDSLVKSAPEPIRKMLEDMEKSAQEANARAVAAEEMLKAEQTARANAEAVEKAKAWKFLGLDAEKIGPALRQLAEINEELAKSIDEVLTSVNAQAESANIFAEIGKSATPATGNAYEQLTSLAKAVTEANAGVSFEQAFSDAVLKNPDLYNQYLSEKGA